MNFFGSLFGLTEIQEAKLIWLHTGLLEEDWHPGIPTRKPIDWVSFWLLGGKKNFWRPKF